MLVTSSAIVLHGFRYSESSKIVRLLTPHYGVQSAIAKGALKPKSRFGAALQLLSEGVAQLYMKPGRDLNTLADFDVTASRQELAHDVARFAAGAAVAELVLRFAPAEAHPEIYDLVGTRLDRLATVPRGELDTAGLIALWAVVSALGFAPTLDACARGGHQLPEGRVAFSVADGGFLCGACARGRKTSRLDQLDRDALVRMVLRGDADIGQLPSRHAAAHRRLLTRFVQSHLAETKDLKALAFWERMA
jgi:DNA repair protein RecO (recombination protein O)